jgi:hypothetical protein
MEGVKHNNTYTVKTEDELKEPCILKGEIS